MKVLTKDTKYIYEAVVCSYAQAAFELYLVEAAFLVSAHQEI
jgi:hypothetical protein